MSLSVNEAQNVWQEHRDSLTRIRTQLSDHRNSPIKSPARGAQKARSGHSPYGNYRQSTPPYLPRLETPPEHEQNRRQLRGDRYEVVPPLKESRKQQSRNTDYDSWGEESEGDEDEEPGQYMPQPYPYQVQPYPQVVFGAPFPVFYPPPPPPARNRRKSKQNENNRKSRQHPETHAGHRQPLTERYEDVNQIKGPGKGVKKQSKVTFNYPMPTNGFYSFPNYPYYPGSGNYEEPPKKKKNNKYKYIEPRDTPYSPGDGARYKEDPQYPDGSPIALVRDDIIAEVIPDMIHSVVRSTLTELVDEHMLYSEESKDPLESFLTRLLNDAVREEAFDVVRETVRDLAHEYVTDQQHEVVFQDLLDDYMEDMLPDLLEESKIDIIGEEFIRDEVIEAELAEEVAVIAKEVLSHYDTKVMRRELKEVSSQAGDKLMESLMLDYLVTLLARQGKVWTESDLQNKALDDMIGTILLQQMFDATVLRRKTIVNKPLQKLHEKAVTDVALEVLMKELAASLDEDLADIDEFEQGITNPYGSRLNTPVHLLGT